MDDGDPIDEDCLTYSSDGAGFCGWDRPPHFTQEISVLIGDHRGLTLMNC
jgi:hypothetical protein